MSLCFGIRQQIKQPCSREKRRVAPEVPDHPSHVLQ